jgi:hypothetical protein
MSALLTHVLFSFPATATTRLPSTNPTYFQKMKSVSRALIKLFPQGSFLQLLLTKTMLPAAAANSSKRTQNTPHPELTYLAG